MTDLSQSNRVPHALSVAHQRLADSLGEGIDQYDRNTRFSNSHEICQAIERFIDELCRVPGGESELQQRSDLIEKRCAPETAYDQAKVKSLKGYTGQPKELSASKLAIRRLRNGEANPSFLGDVVTELQDLERVLGEGTLELNADATDGFQQWLDECRKIQREAKRLEVDGCYYLYHVYQAANPNPSDASEWVRAFIENEDLGGALLDAIRDAANSLIAWVQEKRAGGSKAERPRAENVVREYLVKHRRDFETLISDCIRGDRDATKTYRGIFSPQVIADTTKGGFTRQAIAQTATYKNVLKPPQDKKSPRMPPSYHLELDYSGVNDTIVKMLRPFNEEVM